MIDCHEHDRKWIHEQLNKLPPLMREKVAEKYSELYRETQNRRECNTRLREFTEKQKSRD